MELQSGAQSIHSTFSLLALLRGQTDLALREAQLERRESGATSMWPWRSMPGAIRPRRTRLSTNDRGTG